MRPQLISTLEIDEQTTSIIITEIIILKSLN